MIFIQVTKQFRIDGVNKWALVLSFLIVFLLPPELSGARNVQADNHHSLSTRSVEQQAPQDTGEQKAQEVEALEQGKPIERELAAGESHSYQITLAERDFLSVTVEQRGIDVAVKVVGPDGKQIAEIDFEPRKQGEERVSQVAEAAGDAHRTLRLLERRGQAQDHPVLLSVPETAYLKCLIFNVNH